MTAARKNRWGQRDATMILVAYRHGLRVSELVDLRWDQVDFRTAALHVRRVKQGTPSTHPILGDELRALRRLQREQEPKSPFAFTSERGAPFGTAGSRAWWSARGLRPSLASRRIRTCSDMLADTRWRTGGTTLGHCRLTSATKTSSTRCATRSSHRDVSRTFGASSAPITGLVDSRRSSCSGANFCRRLL
jgi:integrase